MKEDKSEDQQESMDPEGEETNRAFLDNQGKSQQDKTSFEYEDIKIE